MKHIPFFSYIILTLLLLVSCTGRKEAQYREALSEARRQNLAYEPVTGDSLLRCAVDYFDRHGTANDRLLSRYLLGCAYRDLHEAPLALITWEDAVACADTLSPDCDYATLFRVYGQMADVYRRQHLPEKELEVNQRFSYYALRAGDISNYIRGIELQSGAYYMMEDSVGIFQMTEKAKRLYMENGMQQEAAQVYAAAIHFLVNHRHFEQARKLMDIYENESGLFNEQGDIVPSREQYYYYKGMYFLGIGQTDSAEYQFRKLLPVKRDLHDAYLGLFSLYQETQLSDSALKYARMYEDALMQHIADTKIEAVTQAEGMYDYHRHEQIAQKERQRAQKARVILICVLTFVCIACAVIYALYYRKKRREQRKLLFLNNALHLAKDDLAKAYNELSYLRQNLPEKEQTEALLQEKEQRIQTLEAEIEEYQSQLGYINAKTDENALMGTSIVQLLKDISHSRTQKDENGLIQVVHPRACTDDEWKELLNVIQQYHSNLFTYTTEKHKLPKQQFKVCILSRLYFETQEIAVLLGTSPQTISNTRKKIAKKLFDLDDLSLLNGRLAAL